MNDKKEVTNKWDGAVDGVTTSMYRTIMVVLDNLSIFASAAVLAMLLGVSLAMTLIATADWNPYLAATIGFFAAFGLEGYGLKSLKVRFANPDNDELRKKSYIYLIVSIGLLWFDAAVIIASSVLGDELDISGAVIAATGTAFAIISYNYYGISGIETAVAEQKKTAVSQHDNQQAEVARVLARKEKADDEQRRFDMIQTAKDADAKRARQAQAAAAKAMARDTQKAVPLSPSMSPNVYGIAGDKTGQSSAVPLSPVRKGQLSTVYGQLDFDTAVTRAAIADMLGVGLKTAGRVLSTGNEYGVFVTRPDGKRGEHFKNGVDPSTL